MISSARTTPLFIVGPGHSGTTLLFHILAGHRCIYAVHGGPSAHGVETKFFHYLALIRDRFPEVNDEETLGKFVLFVVRCASRTFDLSETEIADDGTVSEWELEILRSAARGQRDPGSVFRIVCDFLARRAGCTHWVEKTPSHLFMADEIKKSIPDARFVEIVRDPRDVLASKKIRRDTVWKSNRYAPEIRAMKHLEKAYDPLWDALSWKSAIRKGQQIAKRYPGDILRVRYEDLVREPPSVIRSICSFAELEYDENMLDFSFRNAADHRASYRSAISSGAIGRAKGTLAPAEMVICQSILSGELERLGYATEEAGLRAAICVPRVLVRSAYEFLIRLRRHALLHERQHCTNRLDSLRYILTRYCRYAKTILVRNARLL